MHRRRCESHRKDIEVALDTASSSRPPIITSFGSTCDSSSCTLCQPTANIGNKQETDFASISSISRASSRSTATLEGYQTSLGLHKKGSTAQPLEQDENCAIAGPSSSQVSSQSEQGTRYGEILGDRTSRKRGAMDDGAAELGLSGSADDFVSVERADLRRSYASSSNLLQDAMEEPKRRCISRPASSESCGEQSGLDCDRVGVPSWQWRSEWEIQEEPIAAFFREVAAFERPTCSHFKRQNADIVCSVEFSPDGSLLASAGVAKQIRVYPLDTIRIGDDFDPEPMEAAFIHRLPSKMSSIAWSPFDEGVLTVGDYDGVVAQVHIASGHLIADVDEHAGRRVWSVAQSSLRPHFCASASDDGTVRLWAGRGLAEAAGTIVLQRGGPICGVSFCPDDEHALALAGADCCAYIYDLRKMCTPLQVLEGHQRPVSFARFMGRDRLVTASVDSSLGLWCLNGGATPSLFRCYRGHANHKNFVGLSVHARDELIACGSESGAAFAYHRAWSKPVAKHSLATPASSFQSLEALQQLAGPAQAQQQGQQGTMRAGNGFTHLESTEVRAISSEFASAVCWWPAELEPFGGGCSGPVLAAARSNGDLRLLSLVNSC
ncbi:probable WD repeat-containing protein RUP1 [Coccomyxa sp. Obi]|nr:probable WD repeat-containing protein RUP1 [Coccomyxa sp. Obi]